MRYVVKHGVRRKPQAATTGQDGEYAETITVYDYASETVDTGLVDKDGNAIHRRRVNPIGFIWPKD